MTNLQIIEACEKMRIKHSNVDWGFKATQTNNAIKIYWGYLKGLNKIDYWTLKISDEGIAVYNEYNEFMNYELENTTDLKDCIQSAAYYMVTRY